MSVKLSLTVSQPPMPSISSARTRVKAQRQPITNNPIAKTAAPHSAVAPSKRPVQPATMRHAAKPAMATSKATRIRARRGDSAKALSHAISRGSGSNSAAARRSEEHTSELQSLMRISYAVLCLKKKKKQKRNEHNEHKHNIQMT